MCSAARECCDTWIQMPGTIIQGGVAEVCGTELGLGVTDSDLEEEEGGKEGGEGGGEREPRTPADGDPALSLKVASFPLMVTVDARRADHDGAFFLSRC
eukprot:2025800-Rhodomonas_salina.6